MPLLVDLALGHTACIEDVLGDDALATRLMEMGLLMGEQIELIGRAPLGDPAEYLVRGYRVSLRRNEAQRIVISDESAPASTNRSDAPPSGLTR